MAAQTTRVTAKHVKPLLSLDRDEARRRAINLYKAWYRQLPYIGTFYYLHLAFNLNKKKNRFFSSQI